MAEITKQNKELLKIGLLSIGWLFAPLTTSTSIAIKEAGVSGSSKSRRALGIAILSDIADVVLTASLFPLSPSLSLAQRAAYTTVAASKGYDYAYAHLTSKS